MKRTILFTLLTLLLLSITACRTNKPEDNNLESSDAKVQSIQTDDISRTEITPEEDTSSTTIQTEHFSIKVPSEWSDICTWEINETSISFIHKESDEHFRKNYGPDSSGGYLFSIMIEDLSFYCNVEAEILGGLGIPNKGEYNVWLLRASDIQTEGDAADEYSMCCAEVDNIVSTLSFNEGYYFSKNPFEIKNDEYILNCQNELQPEPQPQPQPTPTPSRESQEEKKTILSDDKIKSSVKYYCEYTFKRELQAEASKNKRKIVVSPLMYEIVSRTEHTASVRCRMNYIEWVNGEKNKGTFYAIVMIDTYTGEILSANIEQ